MNILLNKNKKPLFLLIFTLLLFLRVFSISDTFNEKYVSTYRIGIMPMNDSLNWIERGQTILENSKIDIRPMFSVFLSYSIFFFGVNMPIFIAMMFLINIIAIITAYILLKDIQRPIFVSFFLSFICAWRVFFLTLILTENLAASFLIIAFAILIKALHERSFNKLFLACFLFGLAQAIRPWDFLSILFIPLIVFFFILPVKRKIILALLLLFATSSAFMFGKVTSLVFSDSRQSKIDIARHLHGQVSGTRAGADLWIIDPELKNDYINMLLGKKNVTEITKKIYERSFDYLKKDPTGLMKNCFFDLKYYFSNFMVGFSKKMFSPLLFAVFLLLFFIFHVLFQESTDKYTKKSVFIIIFVLVLSLFNNIFFVIPVLWSIIHTFKQKHKTLLGVICLYFLSIFLSMCVVGVIGKGRMWASHELFTFFLCALAFAAMIKEKDIFSPQITTIALDYKKLLKVYMTSLLLSSFFFIILPLLTRTIYPDPLKINSEITSQDIQKQLRISKPIISPKQILANVFLWPIPSFEKINNELCFARTIYRPYKATFYEANKGVPPSQYNSKWYMMKLPVERVCYDQRFPIVFPEITKEDLAPLQNKEIIIIGTLVGRPRQTYTQEGFFIAANIVGYPDESGNIQWVLLKDIVQKKTTF